MKIKRLIGTLSLVGIIGFGLMTKNTDTVHSNPYNQSSYFYNNESLNSRPHMNNYSRNNWDEEYYEETMPHHSFENPRENRESERRFYPGRMPHHGHHNKRSFNW